MQFINLLKWPIQEKNKIILTDSNFINKSDGKMKKIKRLKNRANLASKDHGATIVVQQGVDNAKAILSKSKEEYL